MIEKLTNKTLLLLIVIISVATLAWFGKVDADVIYGLIIGALSKGILDDATTKDK